MHPVYNDGVFLVSGISRTTPRKISTALFEGESGLPSLNNKTAFFVFFGKLGKSNKQIFMQALVLALFFFQLKKSL